MCSASRSLSATSSSLDVLVQPLVDAAHHAAIQQPDLAAVHHQQVARVGIGVVEAVVEDHLQADGRPAPGHLVGVNAGRGQPLRVGEA